ncbi:hypothetical protein KJ969_04180 [Patescibacteria group bacterium]|nr:hypothetical protein [Patescibacteria group bacterium]MBU1921987.1 hypothetical protein [Patescibacteria group bacterium]
MQVQLLLFVLLHTQTNGQVPVVRRSGVRSVNGSLSQRSLPFFLKNLKNERR